MDHTYLFQEAVWTARGIYYYESGNAVPLEGRTAVTHGKDVWVNEGHMRVLSPQPVDLKHRYEIVPFEEGRTDTRWESLNPDIGVLRGNFFVVEDSIISTCSSQKGGYTGTEFMMKIREDIYLNRGIFLYEKRIVSSWSVELTRS